MVTVVLNIDGVERKVDTIAYHAGNLDPALKKFGAYLKHKAKKKYDAQNFAPLAEATIAKREQKGLRSVENKLGSSLRRALTSGKARESTKERRAAILVEYQRQYRGGKSKVDWKSRGLDLEGVSSRSKLSLKNIISMNSSVNKAIQKAVAGPVLGRLGQSLRTHVEGGNVTLASRTKKGWSDVHNEGDGHNPKRETIKLENQDLVVFREILIDHFLIDLQ